MTAHTQIARKIMTDIVDGNAFNPYATDPRRTTAEAYHLQDILVDELIRSGKRDAVSGWKIAANAPALMERFKLKAPLSGRVFGNQRQETGAILPASAFTEFAFEPEIAAIMKSDLSPQDGPFDRSTVMAAIDRFVPAIELLDMRNTDMTCVHMPDAIAQNISNEGAVIGGPGILPNHLHVETIRTVVSIDGKVTVDVTGASPQLPLDTVAWLANHLSERGLLLRAGQIVLCGTHSPICYHKGKGSISVQMSGLGEVTMTLE